MHTAQEIKEKIEEANRKHKERSTNMESELDRLLKAEVGTIKTRMKADIKNYLITAKDLGFVAKIKKTKKSGLKIPHKVMHKKDYMTWSGRLTRQTLVI